MTDRGVVQAETGRLIALSINFRDHGTQERERLGRTVAALGPFEERCLVQTCHRSELFALTDELPAVDARVFRGRHAVERAFVLAGGLDSAIVAEEQVLGQVRDAHTLALSRGETGPLLNELFRRAVRFGKHVRSLANPTADRSLADHSARWVMDRTGGEAGARSALVVGTGEMGRLLASQFAAFGLRCTVASRSRDRATDLVEGLPQVPAGPHEIADMDAVPGLIHSHAVVAVAVRRAEPLLQVHDVRGAATLFIDLSAPPALTAEAAAVLGDRLLDLDRLGARDATAALSPRAEAQVRERLAGETDRYLAWVTARRQGTGAALRREAEMVRARHVERLRLRGDLTADQLAAVERMTAALVGELVHLRGEEAREELLAGSQAS